MDTYFILRFDISVYYNFPHITCVMGNTNLNKTFAVDEENIICFIEYLSQCRSKEDILEWASKNTIGTDIIEIVDILVSNEIVISGIEPLIDIDESNRFYSYIMTKSQSIQQFNNAIVNIRKSKIGIVGVGGIGSRVAHELAALGINSFSLVDADIIESHNLQHQISYRKHSIGLSKAEELSKLLTEEYDAKVYSVKELIKGQMSKTTKKSLVNCDLVIVCADEPSVDVVADTMTPFFEENSIPHIVGGGYHSHYTNTGITIVPGKTMGWRDMNSLKKNGTTNLIGNQRIEGITGSYNPLATILSGLIVNEAISVITELWSPNFSGKMGDFNIEDVSFTWRYGFSKSLR
ncbi:ThiF family adenylyltransferase [Bacillus sp. 2205SS5-2]|uniref:ThiF family adenylyltransferase n=1 Tax=Bacillus sp. 2205SS5-2 TaxID=3109031 RepID=UPI0030041BCC